MRAHLGVKSQAGQEVRSMHWRVERNKDVRKGFLEAGLTYTYMYILDKKVFTDWFTAAPFESLKSRQLNLNLVPWVMNEFGSMNLPAYNDQKQ